ncbi:MAG: hypothetical protein AAFW89_05635 [Bacteroidota bacterium]
MHYPIFNSIVNTIDQQLGKRGIVPFKFKKWKDNKIHATGLELVFELGTASGYIHSLSINFDWDSFRETRLAANMEGMEEHPLLSVDTLVETSVNPTIDVELCWYFDGLRCQPNSPLTHSNHRIEHASQWMESLSKEVNDLLGASDIITRWHIEVEGDDRGRYLSAINLISYFQYRMGDLTSVNEVQHFVSRKLQDLLLKANRVMYISEDILTEAVAA